MGVSIPWDEYCRLPMFGVEKEGHYCFVSELVSVVTLSLAPRGRFSQGDFVRQGDSPGAFTGGTCMGAIVRTPLAQSGSRGS